jgi:hypothetical protein
MRSVGPRPEAGKPGVARADRPPVTNSDVMSREGRALSDAGYADNLEAYEQAFDDLLD